MLNLVNYIVSAMVAWVPINEHTYENSEQTIERYTDIANTIVKTSLNNDPLFEGKDAVVKTALLLTAVAATEGRFNKHVDKCNPRGYSAKANDPKKDGKRAWSLWQIHYNPYYKSSKKNLCNSREFASKTALDMMKYSFEHCKHYPLVDRASIYTDGKCSKKSRRSRLKVEKALVYYNQTIDSEKFPYSVN